MPSADATERFSSRVENYRRFRPTYPVEVIDLLRRECGLRKESIVADIAYGTGIFTRPLLETGCRVIGVEPNAEMRQAGQEYLAEFSNFESVTGTAEATTLPDDSVDIITAAQAGHWFDPEKSRQEFARIAKSGGWVVLVWNVRDLDSTPFAREYEQILLRYGVDYTKVRHDGKEAALARHYFGDRMQRVNFPWQQRFDYAELEGRLLSSSYTPSPNDARYDPMLKELRRLFGVYEQQGRVQLDNDTQVYFGQI
jgi:SAM-dependent methyltransferase